MRIQLLLLPLVEIDENSTDQPFALIVDQYDGTPTEEVLKCWQEFGTDCCAVATMVTPETVEVPAEACPPMAFAELPEGSERAQIIHLIKGYFAASEGEVWDDVMTLCGRIERGEHVPSKGAPTEAVN